MCCYWLIWKKAGIFFTNGQVFFKSNRSVWNSEKPNRKQIGNLAGKKMPSKTRNMRSFFIAQHFRVALPAWRDVVPMATIFWLTSFLKFWRGPEAGQLQSAWVPDWTFFRGVGPGPSPGSNTANPSDISPPPSPLACIEMRKLKTYFDQHCYVACFETLFWSAYKSPLPSHVDISLPVYRPC